MFPDGIAPRRLSSFEWYLSFSSASSVSMSGGRLETLLFCAGQL